MYGVKRELVPLISEYPCDAGGMEPYYPMWDIDMYREYENLATSRGIELLGRVARYKYLDIDIATGKAMAIQ
jgi:UDP-galactopyranose mutase